MAEDYSRLRWSYKLTEALHFGRDVLPGNVIKEKEGDSKRVYSEYPKELKCSDAVKVCSCMQSCYMDTFVIGPGRAASNFFSL